MKDKTYGCQRKIIFSVKIGRLYFEFGETVVVYRSIKQMLEGLKKMLQKEE